MALKLGTLQVDIDGNTSGLKTAEAEVNKNTKKINKDLKTVEQVVDKTTKEMNKDFKTVEDVVDKATKEINKDLKTVGQVVGKTTNQVNGKLKGTGKAANDTAKLGFRPAKNAAQQFGFQMQDVIVQLQGGTSAFTVLSQQGSQMAGIFGPGGAVLGAVIALASAVGGILFKSLFEAKKGAEALQDSLKELNDVSAETENGIVILTEKIIKLARESEAAARTEIRGGIVAGLEAIKLASKEAGDTLVDVFGRGLNASGQMARGFENRLNRMSDSMGITRDEMDSVISGLREFRKEASVENLDKLQKQIDAIVASNQKAKPEFIELANNLREFSSSANTAQERVNALKEVQNDLNKALEESNALTSKRGLEGVNFDPFAGGQDFDQLFAEQIAALELRAKLFNDADAAIEAEIMRFQLAALNLFEEGSTDFIAAEEALQEKRIELRQQADDKILSRQKRADKVAEAQRKEAFNQEIEGLTLADQSLSALSQTRLGENKKFAALQAGVSLAINVAKATEIGFPQNLPFIAGAIAQGAQVASLLKGGGRQMGGDVSSQLAHPINEAGVPEILNQGGRQFLLPTGQGGTITPMGGGGGGSANVTIISNGTPQTVEGTQVSREEIAIMINDSGRRTENLINASLASGRGDTARSLQSGFKTERNLR